jgi:hypothetical protein
MDYKVIISHAEMKFRCRVIGHVNPRSFKPLTMCKLFRSELCCIKSWGSYGKLTLYAIYRLGYKP